jgi:2-polyprenyl-6-methoxyphenol hydroxylase-like FAD-dependent oxidoreductase
MGAIDRDALRLGSEAVSFTQDAGGVTLHLEDGSTDTGALLVGADGAHSVIRRSLHPDEPAPRPSGFCAVRGVAYGAGFHLGDLSGVGYLGNAIEAAAVRASSDAVYWYMSLRSRDVADPSPQAILSARCPGFDSALRAILSATWPEDMRFDRLFLRRPLPTWGTGRVTLLGDAAHLLLPHTGQGAAQALEDAVALGLAVGGPGSLEQSLRRYEAVRSRRTRAFIALGPRIARTTTTSNIAIRMARWLAIRLMPEPLLALSARRFHGDPHRELRSGPAA